MTAFLLMRRSSRALGLVMAMGIPLAGRIYPGMTVKGLEETHLAPALATMIVAAFGLGLLS